MKSEVNGPVEGGKSPERCMYISAVSGGRISFVCWCLCVVKKKEVFYK